MEHVSLTETCQLRMSDIVLARLSVYLVLCPVQIEVARNRDMAVLLMPMLTPAHCRVWSMLGV